MCELFAAREMLERDEHEVMKCTESTKLYILCCRITLFTYIWNGMNAHSRITRITKLSCMNVA